MGQFWETTSLMSPSRMILDSFMVYLQNSPHRGGGRRRRARGRGRNTVMLGGLLYSPAAGGDDYEVSSFMVLLSFFKNAQTI